MLAAMLMVSLVAMSFPVAALGQDNGTAPLTEDLSTTNTGQSTPPPATPTCEISASATSVAPGDEVILTLTATDATTAEVQGVGAIDVGGTVTVNPTETTTYTATVTGEGGTDNCDVEVTVEESETLGFQTQSFPSLPSYDLNDISNLGIEDICDTYPIPNCEPNWSTTYLCAVLDQFPDEWPFSFLLSSLCNGGDSGEDDGPSIPTNGAPHDTTLDTNSFTFTWDASTDDETPQDDLTYEFQSSLNPAETGDVLTTDLWESGSLTTNSIVSTGAGDGTWYWQVRAKDADGNYSDWSDIWNVTLDTDGETDPAELAAPTLVSPADGATVSGASVTQVWSSPDEVDHFVYESYHDAGATNLRWRETFTAMSKTATDVADAVYWWRVKAVDSDGNESPWSALWKLIVDNTPPSHPDPDTTRPTLIYIDPSAPNQVYDQTINVTVEARDTESGLDKLVVHFKDTDGQAHLGACGAGLSGLGGTTASTTYSCALDVSGYDEGTYYLRSRATDMEGNGQTVQVAVVIDRSGPSAPQIIFPTNGQVFSSQPILNDWTESSDPNGIQKYEIEYVYSDGHTFSNAPYRETAGNVTERDHEPGIAEQGGVTIRVRAYDTNGNMSEWSNSVYYIYDADGTHVSRIIKPTENETVSGTIDLLAYYQDQNGDGNDGVQWAVRAGTCSQGTVLGNVDGHSDTAAWDSTNFSASFDTTEVDNGEYCFVFNPSEDGGNIDQRLTRVFTVDNEDETPTDPTEPGTFNFIVSGNTASGENDMGGWLFNRDVLTSSPFEFNTGAASLGAGSLFVFPIANTNTSGASGNNPNKDKFIAELFLLEEVANVNSISYDFQIAAPDADAADQFYASVYMNFGSSNPSKFYDCRYSVVPTTGSTGGFTTVTFDPTQSYPVTTRSGAEASPYTCPSVPAEMDALSSNSTIRAISLNVGDESANDTGVSGYLDKVVVNTDSSVTTYDFEPEEEEEEQVTQSRRGGGGGGSRNNDDESEGEVLGVSTTAEEQACSPLLASFLSRGAGNPTEVMSLQGFLNEHMSAGLPVTGFFGPLTAAAVHAFQKKYWEDVLQPWFAIPGSGISDADDSTGVVYKTTQWKINSIHCPGLSLPIPLLP